MFTFSTESAEKSGAKKHSHLPVSPPQSRPPSKRANPWANSQTGARGKAKGEAGESKHQSLCSVGHWAPTLGLWYLESPEEQMSCLCYVLPQRA